MGWKDIIVTHNGDDPRSSNTEFYDGDTAFIDGQRPGVRAAGFNSQEKATVPGQVAGLIAQVITEQIHIRDGESGGHNRGKGDYLDAEGNNIGVQLAQLGLATPTAFDGIDPAIEGARTSGTVRASLGLPRDPAHPELSGAVDQFVRDNSTPFQPNPALMAPVPSRKSKGVFRDAVDRGIDGTQMVLGAAAEFAGRKLGDQHMADYGQQVRQDNTLDLAVNPARVASFTDIYTGEDGKHLSLKEKTDRALTYGAEVLGENVLMAIPDLILAMTGAGVGVVAARHAAIGALTRKFGAQAVSKAMAYPGMGARIAAVEKSGALIGATVPGALSAGTQATGSAYARMKNAGLSDEQIGNSPLASGAAGAGLGVATALVPVHSFMKAAGVGEAVEKTVAAQAGKVVGAVKGFATGAGVGGVVGAAQMAVEQAVHINADDHLDAGDFDVAQMVDAGLRGALTGGAINVGAASLGHATAYARKNLAEYVDQAAMAERTALERDYLDRAMEDGRQATPDGQVSTENMVGAALRADPTKAEAGEVAPTPGDVLKDVGEQRTVSGSGKMHAVQADDIEPLPQVRYDEVARMVTGPDGKLLPLNEVGKLLQTGELSDHELVAYLADPTARKVGSVFSTAPADAVNLHLRQRVEDLRTELSAKYKESRRGGTKYEETERERAVLKAATDALTKGEYKDTDGQVRKRQFKDDISRMKAENSVLSDVLRVFERNVERDDAYASGRQYDWRATYQEAVDAQRRPTKPDPAPLGGERKAGVSDAELPTNTLVDVVRKLPGGEQAVRKVAELVGQAEQMIAALPADKQDSARAQVEATVRARLFKYRDEQQAKAASDETVGDSAELGYGKELETQDEFTQDAGDEFSQDQQVDMMQSDRESGDTWGGNDAQDTLGTGELSVTDGEHLNAVDAIEAVNHYRRQTGYARSVVGQLQAMLPGVDLTGVLGEYNTRQANKLHTEYPEIEATVTAYSQKTGAKAGVRTGSEKDAAVILTRSDQASERAAADHGDVQQHKDVRKVTPKMLQTLKDRIAAGDNAGAVEVLERHGLFPDGVAVDGTAVDRRPLHERAALAGNKRANAAGKAALWLEEEASDGSATPAAFDAQRLTREGLIDQQRMDSNGDLQLTEVGKNGETRQAGFKEVLARAFSEGIAKLLDSNPKLRITDNMIPDSTVIYRDPRSPEAFWTWGDVKPALQKIYERQDQAALLKSEDIGYLRSELNRQNRRAAKGEPADKGFATKLTTRVAELEAERDAAIAGLYRDDDRSAGWAKEGGPDDRGAYFDPETDPTARYVNRDEVVYREQDGTIAKVDRDQLDKDTNDSHAHDSDPTRLPDEAPAQLASKGWKPLRSVQDGKPARHQAEDPAVELAQTKDQLAAAHKNLALHEELAALSEAERNALPNRLREVDQELAYLERDLNNTTAPENTTGGEAPVQQKAAPRQVEDIDTQLHANQVERVTASGQLTKAVERGSITREQAHSWLSRIGQSDAELQAQRGRILQEVQQRRAELLNEQARLRRLVSGMDAQGRSRVARPEVEATVQRLEQRALELERQQLAAKEQAAKTSPADQEPKAKLTEAPATQSVGRRYKPGSEAQQEAVANAVEVVRERSDAVAAVGDKLRVFDRIQQLQKQLDKPAPRNTLAERIRRRAPNEIAELQARIDAIENSIRAQPNLERNVYNRLRMEANRLKNEQAKLEQRLKDLPPAAQRDTSRIETELAALKQRVLSEGLDEAKLRQEHAELQKQMDAADADLRSKREALEQLRDHDAESQSKAAKVNQEALESAPKAVKQAIERLTNGEVEGDSVNATKLVAGLRKKQQTVFGNNRHHGARRVINGLSKVFRQTTKGRLGRISGLLREKSDRFEVNWRLRQQRWVSWMAGVLHGADGKTPKGLQRGYEDLVDGKNTLLARKLSRELGKIVAEIKKVDPTFELDGAPTVLNLGRIHERMAEFREVLNQNGVVKVDELVKALHLSEGVPGFEVFAGSETVKSILGTRKDLAKLKAALPKLRELGFLRTDAPEVITGFVRSAARYAEWGKEYGLLRKTKNGKDYFDSSFQYKALMETISESDRSEVRQLMSAITGSMGHNLPNWVRAVNAGFFAATAARYLLFSAVASIPETAVVAVRAKRGLRAQLQVLTSDLYRLAISDRGGLRALADELGIIDTEVTRHAMQQLYMMDELTVGKTASKVAGVMFKMNGQVALTNLQRMQSLVQAQGFLKEHSAKAAAGDPTSQRYLKELQIDPEKAAETSSPEYKDALHRFVLQAMTNPEAGAMPLWMSDPRFQVFASLKKFIYGLVDRVHMGVYNEGRNGSISQAMAMTAGFAVASMALGSLAEWLREMIKYPPLLTRGRGMPQSFDEKLARVFNATGMQAHAQLLASPRVAYEHEGMFSAMLAGMNPTIEWLMTDLADPSKKAGTKLAEALPVSNQLPWAKAWVMDMVGGNGR